MIKAKKKVYAVFGLGRFGQKIASVLAQKGGTVLVADNNPLQIEAFKNKVSSALLLDSTDENAMQKAPLQDVDIAIVAIGNSLEASIITTTILKQLNIPYIIARASSDIHAKILKSIGATEIINVEESSGSALATRLIAPEILDTVPISKDCSIIETYVPPSFIDQSLKNVLLATKYNVKLVAILRTQVNIDSEGNSDRKEETVFPSENEIFRESDILVLAGENKDLNEFKKLC